MKRCILCLAALLLAACGASGALYLPDHPRPKPGLGNRQHKSDGAQQPAPAANPPAAPDAAPAAPAAPPASPPAGAAPANPDTSTPPATQP